jgi:hypothetical protein
MRATALRIAPRLHDRPNDERDPLVTHAGPDAAGTFELDKPVKRCPESLGHDVSIGAERGYRCRQRLETGPKLRSRISLREPQLGRQDEYGRHARRNKLATRALPPVCEPLSCRLDRPAWSFARMDRGRDLRPSIAEHRQACKILMSARLENSIHLR